MKKMIALLLALLMVASTVVAVSAEGTGAETPTAPKNIQAQTRANKNENQEIVSYDIRFLATVHSTEGKEIGFEVDATFLDQNGETLETKKVTYSKKVNEETDANMAGDSVYTSVMAAGEVLTAEDLIIEEDDDPAIGIFAAVISGVPANLDVVFEINTYVDYEGGTNRSSDFTVQYANGKILNMVGADVYAQDFNATNSVTAATDAGVKNLYGGKMNPTIDNGRLRIPDVGWSHAFLSLIGKNYFSNNVANLGTYAIEMDLDITKKKTFGLYINGSVDDSSNTTNTRNTRTGATFIQFVYDDDDNTKGKTISEMAGKKIYARCAYVTGSGSSSYSSWYELYTIPTSFSDTSPTAKFKLGVVVDSTPTTGCDIHLFIDDTYKATYTLTDTNTLKFDVHANSYVSLLAENTPLTLDNLKVNSVSLTKSAGAVTGYTVTTAATAYSQTFDTDPVTIAGVDRMYDNEKCPSGLPITINGDNQLQIGSHAWHSNPDYFANVVPATGVNGAEVYKFEADIAISSITNVFALTLNNKQGDSLSGANKYLKNALMIRFFMDNTSGALNELQVVEVSATAGTGTTGGAVLSDKYPVTEVSAKSGFKFSVIVDNSVADTCTLYLFINGELVGTYSAVAREHTYTDGNKNSQTTTLDPNVAESSTIGVFAQAAVATIDNIKVTRVKKN